MDDKNCPFPLDDLSENAGMISGMISENAGTMGRLETTNSNDIKDYEAKLRAFSPRPHAMLRLQMISLCLKGIQTRKRLEILISRSPFVDTNSGTLKRLIFVNSAGS
jgi:hypothetical protein